MYVYISLYLAVLSVCAAFVLGAEAVNGLGQDHWRLFASQDYFDKNGVFVTIVLSAPMLVLCFLMLLNGLYQVNIVYTHTHHMPCCTAHVLCYAPHTHVHYTPHSRRARCWSL
jgi:hypothetical protein